MTQRQELSRQISVLQEAIIRLEEDLTLRIRALEDRIAGLDAQKTSVYTEDTYVQRPGNWQQLAGGEMITGTMNVSEEGMRILFGNLEIPAGYHYTETQSPLEALLRCEACNNIIGMWGHVPDRRGIDSRISTHRCLA